MKYLPINIGYYNIKSINNQIFKTRVEKCFSDLQSSVDILEYDKQKYLIGEGNIALDLDKTQKDFTKLCVLNMVSRFAESIEQFKIVITSPPLVYDMQKKELPRYLIDRYRVIHNHKEKEIEIQDVKVYPETITAYIANNIDGKYNNKKVLMLDIGGLTTNGCLISSGNFTKNDIFTIQNGMYHLNNKISQYLNKKYYLNTNIDDIDYFRENGLMLKNNNKDIMIAETEYLYEIYCEFIQSIIQQCELKKWTIDAYEVIITGGGGKILFNIIKNDFIPRAKLSANPIFDNLNGLSIITKKVYGI